MEVFTEQYGRVRINFRHFSGDSHVNLRRALHGYFVDQGIEEKEERTRLVREYMDVIDEVSTLAEVDIFVKEGERKTECKVTLVDELDSAGLPKVYMGYAYCHPIDQYDKDTGRILALYNASDVLPEVTEKTKRALLSGYFAR